MKLRTGDYLYQSQTSIDRQGRRLRTVTRRRVLSVTDDKIDLGGAERMTFPLDEPCEGDWIPCRMMLAHDVSLTWDQLASWSTGFSLRGAA